MTTLASLVGIVTSAALFVAAQPPYALGWLAPVALVPWLVTLRDRGLLGGILSGVAFGTLGAAISDLWIAGALATLGADTAPALFGVVLMSLWGAGLPWGALGGIFAGSKEWSLGRRLAGIGGSVYAVEALRSYLPAGLPWLLLGHTQGEVLGVAQLAVLGGVPAVSALVILVNVSMAGLWEVRGSRTSRPTLRVSAALLGAYGCVAFLGLPVVEHLREQAARPHGQPLDLLLVQPNIPARERWARSVQRTNLAIVARQTQKALSGPEARPDLVIWPETVVTSPIDSDPTLRGDLLGWVARLQVPVILGAARSSGDDRHRYRNSALWVDPGRGFVAEFDKTRAIPVIESGESFPGLGGLRALMGLSSMKRFVEEGSAQGDLRDSASFAVTLCFEALYPGLVSERRGPDTAAILNLANDSWFVSETPSRQQVAFVAFRAIEQRLWLLRVAHGGISAVIDPYGRVVAELPFDEKGELRVVIPRANESGLAERVALAALLVVGAGVGWLTALAIGRRIS